MLGGVDVDVRGRQQACHVVAHAREHQPSVQPARARQQLELGVQLAFADDQEPCPRLGRADADGGLDEQLVAFAGMQRADGRDNQRVGREAELASNGVPIVSLGLRLEGVHVQPDEVEVDQRLLGRADPLQVAANLGRDDQDLLGAERQEPVAQPGRYGQLAG